jgi:uncharacterized DUF497 family protein
MFGKRIVWDERKDRTNRTKHGIGFDEASDVFFDPLALTVDDADHSLQEFRYISIGKTRSQRLVVVFFTENDREIRIISARRPTRTERLSYEEER